MALAGQVKEAIRVFKIQQSLVYKTALWLQLRFVLDPQHQLADGWPCNLFKDMGIGYLGDQPDQPDHHQVEIQSKPIKILSLSCLQGRTLQTGSTRERGSASLTLPAISPLFQPLSPRSTKFYWDWNFCISYTSLSLGHFALPIFTMPRMTSFTRRYLLLSNKSTKHHIPNSSKNISDSTLHSVCKSSLENWRN